MNSIITTPPYTSKNTSDTSMDHSNTTLFNTPTTSRTRSFSITDILADDNTSSSSSSSRKRGSPDPHLNKSYKKPAKMDTNIQQQFISPGSGTASSSGQLLSLVQAGNLVKSHISPAASVSLPPHPVVMNAVSYHQQSQPLASGCYSLNYQLAMLPAPSTLANNYYNISSALAQTKLGGNSSLYTLTHSNTGQLQDNMSDLRINHNQYNGASGLSQVNVMEQQSFRKDDSSEGNSIDTTPDSSRAKPPTQHPTYIPNYFSVSPLALAPGGPNSGFSPSIFLTRPPPTHHIPPTHINEHSPPDTCSTDIITASTPSYMTSTPIRSRNTSNDNNKPFCMESSPSQTQSPITGVTDCSKGHYEQIASISEYSSGSDSETPLLRRPQIPRRRAKARTSLSPRLENTNPLQSHIQCTKPYSYVPQSNLLTSYKLPQSTYTANDSGIVADINSSYTSRNNVQIQYSTSSYRTPVKDHSILAAGSVSGLARLYGNSPVTEHLNKTGQIQSVPPWFVCCDKKSDGKRMRLTEAINKSLSENITHKHLHLPAEWKKLAYGQTDDQKNLTRKARNFLKGRPRVLKFDSHVVCGRP